MSHNKLTPLQASLGSVMVILYALGRQFITAKDKSSRKKLDVKDATYLTSKGLSPTVRNVLTPEAKAFISAGMREGKTDQKIANELVRNNDFLNSVRNIFTTEFLGFLPSQPAQVEVEEEEPAPVPETAAQRAEREEKAEEEARERAYEKEIEDAVKQLQQEERRERKQQAEAKRMNDALIAQAAAEEETNELERLAAIRGDRMPQGLDFFEGIPTSEEKAKIRLAAKKEAEAQTKAQAKAKKEAEAQTKAQAEAQTKAQAKAKKAEEAKAKKAEEAKKAKAKKAEEAKLKPKVPTLARRAADALERTEDAIGRIEKGLQEIKDRMAKIQETPELKTIESKIRNRLTQDGTTEFKGVGDVGLDSESLNQIITTIPQEYRRLLGPAVRGLVGEDLKLNQVISGLVGLAVSVGSGSTVFGLGTKSIIDRVFKAYNINMNDVLTIPEAPAVSSAPAVSVITPSAPPAEEQEPAQQTILEQRFNQLLQLARTPATGARRATPGEVRRGALVGGATGALVGGLSSGSLMTGAGSMMAGGLIGAPVSSLISGQMQRVSELIESKFQNITPERKEQIRMIVQALPPALIAAVMSYNPEDVEPIGTGIITGAGVTERKLTVSLEDIARTKAQETQAPGSNKMWQPKSISPTTDILNETNQMKYSQDLEFIAFDYIAPGSEGAPGTIDTNPLKRSQATADAIRYTDAGVTIPYLLWNQINDASTMTPNRLQKMALGVELPPMEFMEQDNETTFENVATVQYPNNEPMAIEFLSPYADFSNVDNFWAMNPDNMLFTINT